MKSTFLVLESAYIFLALHLPPNSISICPHLQQPVLTAPLGMIQETEIPRGLLWKAAVTRAAARVAASYLLRGAGDDALLKAVGLLLQVFPGLVIPQQVVLDLKSKHTDLSRTCCDLVDGAGISKK